MLDGLAHPRLKGLIHRNWNRRRFYDRSSLTDWDDSRRPKKEARLAASGQAGLNRFAGALMAGELLRE
jgi:hypothetical protein